MFSCDVNPVLVWSVLKQSPSCFLKYLMFKQCDKCEGGNNGSRGF